MLETLQLEHISLRTTESDHIWTSFPHRHLKRWDHVVDIEPAIVEVRYRQRFGTSSTRKRKIPHFWQHIQNNASTKAGAIKKPQKGLSPYRQVHHTTNSINAFPTTLSSWSYRADTQGDGANDFPRDDISQVQHAWRPDRQALRNNLLNSFRWVGKKVLTPAYGPDLSEYFHF